MGLQPNIRMPNAPHRRRSSGLAICGVALFVVGCAPIDPSGAPPELSLPASLSRGKSGAVGKESKELRPGWWRLARDPEFIHLVETALANNFSLAEARARLDSVRTSHASIGQEFRPQSTISASIRQDDNSTNYPTFGKVDLNSTSSVNGFETSWEIDYLGRADMERRASTASIESAQADLALVRSAITAEVLRAYALLSISHEELRVLERALEYTRRIVRLSEIKRDRGFVSELDFARAEAAQRRIETRRPPLLAETAGLRATLGALAGRPEPFEGSVAPLQLGGFRFASLPAELVHNRPDVRAAAASLLRAGAERDLAEADLYPRLRISGDLAIGRGISGNLTSALVGSLGPQIQIPLFDLDLRQARLSAREKGLEAAAFAYRDRVVSAVSEVRRGLANLEQARAQIRRAEAEYKASAREDHISEILFRGGSLDLGERLRSALALAEAELTVLAARRQEVHSLVFTVKAIAHEP